MELHWVDYVILAVVGLSVLTGLFRGFIKELVALSVWILAIWLAYSYSEVLDPILQPYIHDKHVRMVVSFIGILISTLIVGALFNALLSFILSRSGMSGTDRLLGMGFGLVRGVFIVSLVMLVVKLTSLPYQEYSNQSKLYAKFDPMVHWLSGYVPEFVTQLNQIEGNTPEESSDSSVAMNEIQVDTIELTDEHEQHPF